MPGNFRVVNSLIHKLPDRGKKMTAMIFGIGTSKHTRADAEKKFGVSKERIRQIMEKI